MVSARNIGLISELGLMTFKSPPSKIPEIWTKDARAMSSAVSPEAGTITSFPVLYIEFGTAASKSIYFINDYFIFCIKSTI